MWNWERSPIKHMGKFMIWYCHSGSWYFRHVWIMTLSSWILCDPCDWFLCFLAENFHSVGTWAALIINFRNNQLVRRAAYPSTKPSLPPTVPHHTSSRQRRHLKEHGRYSSLQNSAAYYNGRIRLHSSPYERRRTYVTFRCNICCTNVSTNLTAPNQSKNASSLQITLVFCIF